MVLGGSDHTATCCGEHHWNTLSWPPSCTQMLIMTPLLNLQTDPTRFVSGGDDGTVRLWSMRDYAATAAIDTKANVCSVQMSPTDANLLAFGSANYRVYLYDLRKASSWSLHHWYKGCTSFQGCDCEWWTKDTPTRVKINNMHALKKFASSQKTAAKYCLVIPARSLL